MLDDISYKYILGSAPQLDEYRPATGAVYIPPYFNYLQSGTMKENVKGIV